MSFLTFIPIFLYFLLLAFLIQRRGRPRSFLSYALADKKAGGVETAFSYFTVAESIWLLLAVTSSGYVMGLQTLWIIAGEVFFISIYLFFLARRIRSLGDLTSSRTTIDLISRLTNDRSGLVKITGTLILAIVVPGYISSQFVALGKITRTLFGYDVTTSVLVSSVVILSFSLAASFSSMCSTHILQGLLRVMVLVLALVFCVQQIHSVSQIVEEASKADLLSLLGAGPFSFPHFFAMLSLFLVGFDLIAMPQLALRFMACRSDAEIKKAIPIIIVVHLIACLTAMTVGIFGRVLFPGLIDPELILPVILKAQDNPWIIGFGFSCMLAAIMSTADQLLHTLGLSVSWDVVHSLIDSNLSEKNLIRISKITVLVGGIIGVVLSQTELQVVDLLVRYACSALAAGFGPVFVLCLLQRKVRRNEAVAGLVAGAASAVAYGRIFSPAVGVEIAVGLLMGILAIGLVKTRTAFA